MATQVLINGDIDTMVALLEESELFDTVEKVNQPIGSNTLSSIKATKNSNNMIIYWGFKVANSTTECYGFVDHAGIAEGTYFTNYTSAESAKAYRPESAYKCSGGIIIVCKYGRVLLTKNNAGDTVVCFGNGTVADTNILENAMGSICALAETDTDMPLNSFMYNSTGIGNQTFLMPLCSQSSFGVSSYTNTAALMLLAQSRSLGNISYNGKTYFTDGYFAVEDE